MGDTRMGETINLGGTNLKVLTSPKPSPRDGNWRIRARVLDGEWRNQELWLVSHKASGPWETSDAGFV